MKNKIEILHFAFHELKQLQQYSVMQAEVSDGAKGAAVGQRSGDTVAAGRTCDKYCTGPWDCKCQDVLAAFYRTDAGSSHEEQP
jgi:hypothetical protein